MQCPVCGQAMTMTATETTDVHTCGGPDWSSHDPITYHPEDQAYHATSPGVVQWFRENGYAIRSAGGRYEMRPKKGLLARLFQR